jgi:hypothetical protein
LVEIETTIDGENDDANFNSLFGAGAAGGGAGGAGVAGGEGQLQLAGFKEQEIRWVVELLALVLHVGNVHFVEADSDGGVGGGGGGADGDERGSVTTEASVRHVLLVARVLLGNESHQQQARQQREQDLLPVLQLAFERRTIVVKGEALSILQSPLQVLINTIHYTLYSLYSLYSIAGSLLRAVAVQACLLRPLHLGSSTTQRIAKRRV